MDRLDWDAAGEKSRRRHVLPPHNNGFVLITLLKQASLLIRMRRVDSWSITFSADTYYKQREFDVKAGAPKSYLVSDSNYTERAGCNHYVRSFCES